MSKKKIFYALTVFLILGMTMSALNTRAHAPINIDMEFNVRTQKLSVIYTHGVSEPTEHYIESIEVWVNATQVWMHHEDHTYHYDDQDNYATAEIPSEASNYTFNYIEQPTDITPVTVSHTLAHYYLDFSLFLPFNATQTGEILPGPIHEDTGEPVGFIGEGRTNITLSATCSNGGVLTEHYYVGLPYYNPHLTFAEAAMPATVSTIIVLALLFLLPLVGQKNAPKFKEEKSRKSKK